MKKIIQFHLVLFIHFSLLAQYQIQNEPFDNNANAWFIGNGIQYDVTIDSSNYQIHTQQDKGTFLFWTSNLTLDFEQDFRIELDIKNLNLISQNATFGLVWGGLDGQNYASVQIDRSMNLSPKLESGNFYHDSLLDKTATIIDELRYANLPLKNTKIILDKFDGRFNVFVNKTWITAFEAAEVKGNNIGFEVFGDTEIEIESMQIIAPKRGKWIQESDISFMPNRPTFSYTKQKQIKKELQIKNTNVVTRIGVHLNTNYTKKNSKKITLQKGINQLQAYAFDKYNHSVAINKWIRNSDSIDIDTSKLALFFVNDTFQNWESLNTPSLEADTIATLLHFVYGFKTKIIYNTNYQEFIEELSTLKTKNLSQLILYFAGHGAIDSVGNRYWISADSPSNINKSSENLITWDEVNLHILDYSCDSVLMLINTCYGPNDLSKKYIKNKANAANGFIAAGNKLVTDGSKNKLSPFVKFIYQHLGFVGGDYNETILYFMDKPYYEIYPYPNGRFGRINELKGTNYYLKVKE